MLGFGGGFIVGIGLFNFVAIIINQYLVHTVSIGSILVGSILILIRFVPMGLCNAQFIKPNTINPDRF